MFYLVTVVTPKNITLHKEQTAVRNGLTKNTISTKRKVYKASTPGSSTAEKNLMVILNSLKAKVHEITPGGEMLEKNVVGNFINVV